MEFHSKKNVVKLYAKEYKKNSFFLKAVFLLSTLTESVVTQHQKQVLHSVRFVVQ